MAVKNNNSKQGEHIGEHTVGHSGLSAPGEIQNLAIDELSPSGGGGE